MSQPAKDEKDSSYSISLRLRIEGREKPSVLPWVLVVLFALVLGTPWLQGLLKQLF